MKDKYYAQFYDEPVGRKGCHASQLIPVCGNLGVMYLDGRHSTRRMDDIAVAEAKKRGFCGAQVRFGTFTHVIRSGWLRDARDTVQS